MRHRWISWVLLLVCIPLVILLGAVLLEDRQYGVISLCVALLAMLPFYLVFERRKTGSRKLTVIAVMTALSVAGRFVFAAVPACKPVTAMVVLTAVYFGSEAGFLTGALTALISNFYFGQGPWTPFQMFAWGMLGLLAGLLHAPLAKSRWLLALYGLFAGALYSMVMDVWSVVWYSPAFSMQLYGAALVTALPHTLLYAASNAVFLWLLAKPLGRKMERVQKKFGI